MQYCTTNESDLKRIYLFELLSARRKDGIKCILSIGNWNKSASDYAEKTIYEIQAQEKRSFMYTDLISLPDSFEIPFFDEDNKKELCKIYNDGGHYVAIPYQSKKLPNKKNFCVEREIFDTLYSQAVKDGKNETETKNFLYDNLCTYFKDEKKLEEFINKEMERVAFNFYQRKKRFKRKAYMNKWTHFITITYSDKMLNEEEFRIKLRKCLCNFHTRRGWKYMGVFERAPETGRLHFHALLYVPAGEMVGSLTEKQDFSTKNHKMQKTIENSFFAEKFGRNDFKEITVGEIKVGNTLSYILKYIQKTGERIVYSRNLPEFIYKELGNEDIASKIEDFVIKYVLFDDVIDWEKDIANISYEQQNIFALMRKKTLKGIARAFVKAD